MDFLGGIALWSAFVWSAAFGDMVSCTVQGYVYRTHDADPVSYQEVSPCQGVRVTSQANALLMESPTHWVMVVIPPEYGHRRFVYVWGKDVAHIGVVVIRVVSGIRD